jgi:magnesium chelatase subunit I
MLVVASANPEDYTNRGRIITPLKDRFGAEIRTHYPLDLDLEIALLRQEAAIQAIVPQHILEVVARFTSMVRASESVDQRSGVSARFSIACVEELSGAALRRSAINGDSEPVVRISDLADVVASLRGKVEFELSQEGTEIETLTLLARQATAGSWRALLGGQQTRPFLTNLVEWFDSGNTLTTTELMSSKEILAAIGPMEGLGSLVTSAEPGIAESPGLVASCIEFAIEGLWLTRRIDKNEHNGAFTYGGKESTTESQ